VLAEHCFNLGGPARDNFTSLIVAWFIFATAFRTMSLQDNNGEVVRLTSSSENYKLEIIRTPLSMVILTYNLGFLIRKDILSCQGLKETVTMCKYRDIKLEKIE